VSRRRALAIWAACLAGGVAIGVVTDGGTVAPARPERTDPASEGTNVDAAGWNPPGADEASRSARPSQEAVDSSGRRGDDDEAPADRPDRTETTSEPRRRSPHRSRPGRLDGRDSRTIIETIVPVIVIPPFGGQPAEPSESTTTTEPPSTTTTTEPSTTTTSSVPPDPGGGTGPIDTPPLGRQG
jgi:hypothetical protein